MRYKMKLSEFLALSYKDRVNLLFECCNYEFSDKRYILEWYKNDYKKVFNHHFKMFDDMPVDLIKKSHWARVDIDDDRSDEEKKYNEWAWLYER